HRVRPGEVQVGAVDHGDGDLLAVGGGGPQPVGGVLPAVVAAADLLLLEQGEFTGRDAVVVQARRGGEGAVGDPDDGGVPLRVAQGAGGVELLVELQLGEGAVAAGGGQLHDGEAADGPAAVGEDDVALEGVHAFDP